MIKIFGFDDRFQSINHLDIVPDNLWLKSIFFTLCKTKIIKLPKVILTKFNLPENRLCKVRY